MGTRTTSDFTPVRNATTPRRIRRKVRARELFEIAFIAVLLRTVPREDEAPRR
jgi:hypothetical protein